MTHLTVVDTSATIGDASGDADLVIAQAEDWAPMLARHRSGPALGACLGMIWVYIPAVFAVLITEHIAFMLLVLGGAGVGAA